MMLIPLGASVLVSYAGKALGGIGNDPNFFVEAMKGVLSNELHASLRDLAAHFSVDSSTGLPRNHDIQRASCDALRQSALLLIAEQAGMLEPQKPWIPTIWEHVRSGKIFNEPLLEARNDPKREWLEALRKAVLNTDRFDLWHEELKIDSSLCFGPNDVPFAEFLSKAFIDFARTDAKRGDEPPGFEHLVQKGWRSEAGKSPVRLDQVYRLFFREALKHRPEVFSIHVADALAELQTSVNKLSAKGDPIAAKTIDELQKSVQSIPRDVKLLFDSFQVWLAPQLGELRVMAQSLAAQSEAIFELVKAQNDTKAQLQDIQTALVSLNLESSRGEHPAQVALNSIFDQLKSIDTKLDYLIGGIHVTRFTKSAAASNELDLLKARYREITLVARDADLDSLWAWLNGGGISARLIVGRAGTGKTRLAYEFLLQLYKQLPTWEAGLVRQEDLKSFANNKSFSDFNWSKPTLLVIDYAQPIADLLTQFFKALAFKTNENNDSVPPLRILLLERVAEPWFEPMLKSGDSASREISTLFSPPTTVNLTPIPEGTARLNLLKQALEIAARLGKHPVPPIPAGDPAFEASLARADFANPLNLIMAALASSSLGISVALTRSRIDLALTIADKEKNRIGRFANGDADREALLCNMAACATMERGFLAKELDDAAKQETEATQRNWPNGLAGLKETLIQALPGENSLCVSPIEPDFVGEAFVLEILAEPYPKGAPSPERWNRWCEAVERCFRRDPRSSAATLLHTIQNFALETKDAVNVKATDHHERLFVAVRWMITKGINDSDISLLLGIGAALPEQSTILLQESVQVTQAIYDQFKKRARSKETTHLSEFAGVANNLAVRLSALGRREEALGPAQEAVEICKDLAQQNPQAYRPALASSLINLSGRLSKLGRREEALGTAQEAVEICRDLAQQNSQAFRLDLARSLNNLATFLSELGGKEEALGSAQEALEIFKDLAQQNPQAFRPELAMSLNNLSGRLSELGRMEEALGPAQESVEIRRDLAQQDLQAFRPGLAMSLNNLATFLSELGRREEALGPAQEAVEICRDLAQQNSPAFRPDLAMSCGMFGQILEANDEPKRAFDCYAEGLKMITPHLIQLPAAHKPLAGDLLQCYVERATTSGYELDMALLKPIMDVLGIKPEE